MPFWASSKPRPRTIFAGIGLIVIILSAQIWTTNIGFSYRTSEEWSAPIEEVVVETGPSLVDIALDGSWREDNVKAFNARNNATLQSCLSGGPCGKNQNKLILMGWGHFEQTITGGMQGENVWCDAIIDAMNAIGYSMLILRETDELLDAFRQYHDLVKLVLWQDAPWHGGPCLRDPTCVHLDTDVPAPPPNATHLNLPIWKVFGMHWWNGPDHPLGGPFTISPENYTSWPGHAHGADNYYLGYSLEKTCLKTPYVPYEERPRQAYVFAKYIRYFVDGNSILREEGVEPKEQVHTDLFVNLSRDLNMTFIGNPKHDIPDVETPKGIIEIPRTDRPTFQNKVARTRLVMGVGGPALSPTPWESLCLGVPFLNPVKGWNSEHPEDRSGWWSAQHEGVLHLGLDEPYVYHVRVGERASLEGAVKRAMETPIERWIPPQMRMSALIERTERLVETDWWPTAKEQMLKIGDKYGSKS